MENMPPDKSGNTSKNAGKNFWVIVLLPAVTFYLTAARGSVSSPAGGQGWTRKSSVTGDMPIPNDGKQQTCCLVLDIDKDGIDDFVIGERTGAPSVVWYKYNGKGWPAAAGWDKLVIDNTRKNPEAGGDFCDIDRDADLDIILGQDASGNNIWWWENPYPDFSKPWTCRHIKNSGGNKHHDQTVGDFDGDGQVELVSWNQQAKQLLLFEIPAEPKSSGPWPSTTIYSWASGREREGFPSLPVDIDLDDKVDIVGGGRWFKHLGGTKYEENIIDPEMAFTQCAAGQLVKGGWPEVVFSPGDMDGDAKWYQWDGTQWYAHTLRYVVHGHTCEMRDIDGDGNMDIFIGEMGIPGAGDDAKTYIWYGDGKGNFTETIAFVGQGIHEGKLGDLDGDGDLDILMKPYSHRTPRVDVLLNPGLIVHRETGDEAIEKDEAVIFAEGFEGGKITVGPEAFYDLKGYPKQMDITDKEAAVGKHSLELVHPAGVISPQWLHRKFPGQDTVYVRFYRKFEKDWVWPPLGAHDTYLFAGRYDNPASTDLTLYLDIPQGPSQRVDKRNWDLARQPELVLKSSFQGPGLDFGLKKQIVSHVGWDNYYSLPYNVKAAPVLEAGRWYCFEYMAKMNNTPDRKDGEVRLWVDGILITEMKELLLRNVGHPDIKWDHWMLGPRYGGKDFKSGPPRQQKSWIDGIVVSTRYVGPVKR